MRSALIGLALRTLIVGLVGGRRRWAGRPDRLADAGGPAGGGAAGDRRGLGAAATFNANAVSEPRYSGLLTRAPAAVGDVEAVLDRFGEYRAQLGDLVDNVATLYLAGEQLPTFEPAGRSGCCT